MPSPEQVSPNSGPPDFSHFVSALLINAVMPVFFHDMPGIGKFLEVLAQAYLVISGVLLANAALNGARDLAETSPAAPRNIPFTSIVQILKLVVLVIALAGLISSFQIEATGTP